MSPYITLLVGATVTEFIQSTSVMATAHGETPRPGNDVVARAMDGWNTSSGPGKILPGPHDFRGRSTVPAVSDPASVGKSRGSRAKNTRFWRKSHAPQATEKAKTSSCPHAAHSRFVPFHPGLTNVKVQATENCILSLSFPLPGAGPYRTAIICLRAADTPAE